MTDDINYRFTENGVVYDFYDVFVPAELFRKPSLWVWGANGSGQLGTNDTTTRRTPSTTFSGGTNWKSIECGDLTTAAIKTDGTLWTWGYNGLGQLATNNTINKSTPVTTFLEDNGWKQVSSSYNNTAAIKTDGTLWVWGINNFGQLGINDTINRSTPVTTILGGNNWKQVSFGFTYVAAIKTDGSLWIWGGNTYGSLGINNTIDRSTPVTTILGGTNWKSIASQGYHPTAIKTDGSLWIWGYNTYGSLGINDTIHRSTPVTTILGGTNWKTLSKGGPAHTAAIKTDGTLWTWGANSSGQLGINNTIDRSTPVTTFAGGNDWKSVSSGYGSVGPPPQSFTSAIKTDGTLWTWGDNSSGQLGINNIIDRSTPVTTFLGGNNWKQVSCGFNHIVAIEYEPDPTL